MPKVGFEIETLAKITANTKNSRYFKSLYEWKEYYVLPGRRASKEFYTSMQNLEGNAIYQIWEEEEWYSVNNPTPDEEFISNTRSQKTVIILKPLTLKTNIVTAFYILLISACVALLMSGNNF